MRHLLLICALATAARAIELQGNDLRYTIEPRGCGYLDRLTFQGRDLVRAQPGFVGASLTLAPAGDGSLDSLFDHRAPRVLKPELLTVEGQGQGWGAEVTGVYTDGPLRVPFRRTYASDAEGWLVTVTEETDYTAVPPAWLVASHRLDLPLVVDPDEHNRLLGLGGERRAELFRMDQNDVKRLTQNLSDNRAYWPYWDLGGLIQRPEGYELWKSNHADTLPLPLETGRQSRAWADFSSLAAGLTLVVRDAAQAAPWALLVDARAGRLSLALCPPSEPARPGAALGKRTVRWGLLPHERSWPALAGCEMRLDRYAEFLGWLKAKGPGQRYSHLDDFAASGLGTADVATIIDKERIQPSTVLRLFYAGDAWRMGGFAKAILGRDVPRNQPLAAWELVAKAMLDKIARDGVPAPPR